jgi:hypothetical protein
MGHQKRPPSYSESFIQIDREHMYDELPERRKPLSIQYINTVEIPKGRGVFILIIKSSIHLFLISAFETIFYFTYVSKKEDGGIENTINTYYTPIKNSCPSWSNTTRWIVYEILTSGQEISKITSLGTDSYKSRMEVNTRLLYYSLGSSAIFLVILLAVSGILICRDIKIKWCKTLCENIMMVLVLGIYEYIFFMAIISNYNSISTNELNSYIANGIYDCVRGE